MNQTPHDQPADRRPPLSPARQTGISTFLSRVLRHDPARIGIVLDTAGWTDTDTLIAAAARHGRRFTRDELETVVAENAKQRFALSADGSRIRANQGHSVPVDLGLDAVEPPAVLYHGTAERTLDTILREGLRPMRRHAVHLSSDAATARTVGARHGRPAVLTVDAAAMAADGRTFLRSANGVWLTEAVPPRYLRRG